MMGVSTLAIATCGVRVDNASLVKCTFEGLQDQPLANLAIPGSHNAAAYAGTRLNWADCLVADQGLSLDLQALAGVRFFDLDLELSSAGQVRTWHGSSDMHASMELTFVSLSDVIDSLAVVVSACSRSDFFVFYVSDVRCDQSLRLSAGSCRQRVTAEVSDAAAARWGPGRVLTEYRSAMAPPRTVQSVRGKLFVLGPEVAQTWCSACQTVEEQIRRCSMASAGAWRSELLRVDLYSTTSCGNAAFVDARRSLFGNCSSARRSAEYPTAYAVDAVGLLDGKDQSEGAETYPSDWVARLNLQRSSVSGLVAQTFDMKTSLGDTALASPQLSSIATGRRVRRTAFDLQLLGTVFLVLAVMLALVLCRRARLAQTVPMYSECLQA